MNDLTVLITNRDGKHINRVIDNINEIYSPYFDDIKFVIVHLDDNNVFKRGQLLNIAINYVSTKYILITDNDIINFHPINLINEYNLHGPFLLFDKITLLEIAKDNISYNHLETQDRTYGYGICFLSKQDFLNCNGFSNLMFGWGAEDDIFALRVNFYRLENTLGHIKHPKRSNNVISLLHLNRAILNKYKNNEINSLYDGYNQTVFTLSNAIEHNNIIELFVNSISVVDDFKYKDLYNKQILLEQKVLTTKYEFGISICVTMYNSMEYLRETLDSIFKLSYFKTHGNWEVLLGIDGNLKDLQYLKTIIYKYNVSDSHFRILLMKQHVGTYITSNTLFNEAKYEYMLRFDSDDIMSEDFIEKLVENMSGYDGVRVKAIKFGEQQSDSFYAYGCSCISKKLFHQYGGYQPWQIESDSELWHRIINLSDAKILMSNDIIYYYRVRSGSLFNSSNTGDKSSLRQQLRKQYSKSPVIDTRISDFLEYKTKVAICAIAKMENNYIREWVEHYKNIGVDTIFLYDNNAINGERFEDVINDYITSGFVLLIDIRGLKELQIRVYNKCYKEYSQEFQWIGFFDCDEFLQFDKKYLNIKHFLNRKEYNNFNVIKINWKLYTDSEILSPNGDYSIKKFTDYITNLESYYMHASKSLVRTKYDLYFDINSNGTMHCPTGDKLKACNVLGEPEFCYTTNKQVIYEIAWINHYSLKTIEEYVTNKMQRLYPDLLDSSSKNKLNLERFWWINKKTDEKLQYANNLLMKLSQNK